MFISTPRYLLRDFVEAERPDFVAYQMDPRYLRLYDYAPDDWRRAEALFDLFLSWQAQTPRENFQLGIFERVSGRLCGSAGLRTSCRADGAGVLGIELAPQHWGRYRLALEVVSALIDYAFGDLELPLIVGDTSSGNTRVAKLARWFGAEIVAQREGPDWMTARGWREVDWSLRREAWLARKPTD